MSILKPAIPVDKCLENVHVSDTTNGKENEDLIAADKITFSLQYESLNKKKAQVSNTRAWVYPVRTIHIAASLERVHSFVNIIVS